MTADPAAEVMAAAMHRLTGRYRNSVMVGHLLAELCNAGLVEPDYASTGIREAAMATYEAAIHQTVHIDEQCALVARDLRAAGYLT